jgi:nucleotide-binding universal stress UspA family protein
MSELLYVLLAAAIVVVGTIIISKLSKHGVQLDDVVDNVKKAINVAELILASIDIDESKKEKPTFVLDVADMVADYVVALEDTDNKEQLALQTIDEVLKKFGITPSESEQKLIQIIVKESLDFAEKKLK